MLKWRDDFENAPKETPFLVLLPSALVTTASYHWYTEDDHEAFSRVAYWALHDLVRDEPMDENGPAETLGLKWSPMTEAA